MEALNSSQMKKRKQMGSVVTSVTSSKDLKILRPIKGLKTGYSCSAQLLAQRYCPKKMNMIINSIILHQCIRVMTLQPPRE